MTVEVAKLQIPLPAEKGRRRTRSRPAFLKFVHQHEGTRLQQYHRSR
jgi:hypothetical protein